ncbi:hypothetical protein SFRURICE_011169 [Spodoptera frugiperda]|nr:hypothetical protein SFRURICE_011169 [Spodoptera frugiperda]
MGLITQMVKVGTIPHCNNKTSPLLVLRPPRDVTAPMLGLKWLNAALIEVTSGPHLFTPVYSMSAQLTTLQFLVTTRNICRATCDTTRDVGRRRTMSSDIAATLLTVRQERDPATRRVTSRGFGYTVVGDCGAARAPVSTRARAAPAPAHGWLVGCVLLV